MRVRPQMWGAERELIMHRCMPAAQRAFSPPQLPWSATWRGLRRSAQFQPLPPQLPSFRKTLISLPTRCMQRVGEFGIGLAVATFYGSALQISRGMLAVEGALITAGLSAAGIVGLTHWINL